MLNTMLTWTGHVTCKQQEVLLNIELRVNKQKITLSSLNHGRTLNEAWLFITIND